MCVCEYINTYIYIYIYIERERYIYIHTHISAQDALMLCGCLPGFKSL